MQGRSFDIEIRRPAVWTCGFWRKKWFQISFTSALISLLSHSHIYFRSLLHEILKFRFLKNSVPVMSQSGEKDHSGNEGNTSDNHREQKIESNVGSSAFPPLKSFLPSEQPVVIPISNESCMIINVTGWRRCQAKSKLFATQNGGTSETKINNGSRGR